MSAVVFGLLMALLLSATGAQANEGEGGWGITPLTAAASSVPERHDGSDDVSFTVTFSEEIDIGYVAMRDSAFTVTGGTVENASRVTARSNLAWNMRVSPSGNAAITMSLPANRPCHQAGAICTSGGKKLSETLTIEIPGPPAPKTPLKQGKTQTVALTAAASSVPERHDGSADVSFTVTFSEEIDIGYEAMRDSAFTVTGGTVESASRVTARSNLAWNMRVSPSGNAAISMSLPADRPCDQAGAICTSGGKKLSEALTVEIPGPVAARTQTVALTAAASDVPARHDGSADVSFTVTFSEEIDINIAAMRDSAFTVTGGTVAGASRVTPGSNLAWIMRVSPSGDAAISMSLPADRPCNKTGAICTSGGKKLSETLSVEISGPEAPEITSSGTFTVNEGWTRVAQLTATDPDTESAGLEWSLAGGDDSSHFSLNAVGELAFTGPKDYEAPDDDGADGTYEVTVQVSDGGRTDSADIEVALADVDEAATAPLPPAMPTVVDAGRNGLSVTWTAPDNSAITGYDLQYRTVDETAWTDGPQDVTGTEAEIEELRADANYHVRVRSQTADDEGTWSDYGVGTTALWEAQLDVGSSSGRPDGWVGYERAVSQSVGTFGSLDRAWVVYNNTLYEFPILARYTGWRGHGDGMHRHSLDFYVWDRELPDDWVLRVGDHRFKISEARTGFLGGVNEPGRPKWKAYWINPGMDLRFGGQYEVSLSRDPQRSTHAPPVVVPEPQLGQLAGLALTRDSDGDIAAAWLPPLDPEETPFGYHVAYIDVGGAYSDFVYAREPSLTITGLEAATAYKVRVRAYYSLLSSHPTLQGPWMEGVVEGLDVPEPVVEPEVIPRFDELEFALQRSDQLSTAAESLSHDDNVLWSDHLGTVYARASHDRVVLEWAKRSADVAAYKIWRKANHDTAYTLLARQPSEGEFPILTVTVPPGGTPDTHFYHVDETVAAATAYDYVVQAEFGSAGSGFSVPVELAAHTTQWFDPPSRYPPPPPTNAEGQYLLPVGNRAVVVPTRDDLDIEYRVTLAAGEAYRVVLYDEYGHANSGGHDHGAGDFTFRGDIVMGNERDGDGDEQLHIADSDHEHHSRHVALHSIARDTDGRRISYRDSTDPVYFVTGVYATSQELINPCGCGTDAYLFYAPSSDDYVITVDAAHELAAHAIAVYRVEDQPNSPSFAYPLEFETQRGPVGSGYQAATAGHISADDADWFLVELEPYKTYDFELVPIWPKGLGNPRLRLAGRDGVERTIPGSSNSQFSMTISSAEGGYYHVGVSGASPSDTGLYVLHITERDFGKYTVGQRRTGVDEFGTPIFANSAVLVPSSALRIDAGREVIGMIDSIDDRDYFSVWLECNKTYRIQVRGSYYDTDSRMFAVRVHLEGKAWYSSGNPVRASAITRVTQDENGSRIPYQSSIQQISEIEFDPPCSGRGEIYIFGLLNPGIFDDDSNSLIAVEETSGRVSGRTIGAYYFKVYQR